MRVFVCSVYACVFAHFSHQLGEISVMMFLVCQEAIMIMIMAMLMVLTIKTFCRTTMCVCMFVCAYACMKACMRGPADKLR